MDQIFDQAKVQISPTLKAWEPQRRYEKKLSNVMNKDKGGSTVFVLVVVYSDKLNFSYRGSKKENRQGHSERW